MSMCVLSLEFLHLTIEFPGICTVVHICCRVQSCYRNNYYLLRIVSHLLRKTYVSVTCIHNIVELGTTV